MRAFVGIGQSDNIEAAVNEATSGIRTADLFILTAPFNKAEDSATFLSQKYPGVPVIGTTAPSVGKGSYSETNLTIIAFAGVTVATGIIEDTVKAPVNYIKDFEDNLKSIEPAAHNTICIDFITNNEEKTVSTMNSVLNRYNISLAGATAYGTPLGEQPSVIYNGKIYKKSCVYAFIKNNSGRIHVHKEDIYEPLSTSPHFATLVDTNTKTLFQLDNEPAFEVYSAETGVTKDEIVSNMINNPLGRVLGDDIFIASTLSLDMNGVMFNGKIINENDSVFIMQAGDFRSINEDTLSTIKSVSSKRSFVLGFDSISRIKLFDREGFTDDYLSNMSTLGNYTAIVTEGQQYNSQHVNQTLVCVIFD